MVWTSQEIDEISRLLDKHFKLLKNRGKTYSHTREEHDRLRKLLAKSLVEYGNGGGVLPDPETEHGILPQDGEMITVGGDEAHIELTWRGARALIRAGVKIDGITQLAEGNVPGR